MKNDKPGRGWAWALEDGSLCHWAHPTRDDLVGEEMRKGRPSTNAKKVSVRIVKTSDYNRMMRILRGRES